MDLEGELAFCGNFHQCFTCTCLFFSTTRIICKCICAAARVAKRDIYAPGNIYPYWLVYNHPKWTEACNSLMVEDYKNMPNKVFHTTESIDKIHMNMLNIDSMNSKIFDQLGDYSHYPKAQRVVVLREAANDLIDVASLSERQFKIAYAKILGLTNQLSSLKIGSGAIVRLDAVERSRGRGSKNALDNRSRLSILGRNDDTSVSKLSKARSTNCTICRDKYHEPFSVYHGHRASSSRCPHTIKQGDCLSQPQDKSLMARAEGCSNNAGDDDGQTVFELEQRGLKRRK